MMGFRRSQDAQTALYQILGNAYAAERVRLDQIRGAMKTHRDPENAGRLVEIPDDAPPVMRRLAVKAQTNYLPLVLDTFGQVMKVDGLYTKSDEKATPWLHWQRNRMDARQTGLHRGALQYGASYAAVWPGKPSPVIKLYSPLQCCALYQDESADEWPMLAVIIDRQHTYLVDETSVYDFATPWKMPLWQQPTEWLQMLPAGVEFVEKRDHGLGFVPIVRYRDRQLLNGEEVYGIVEPLVEVQQRIHETNFGGLVAQYFAAFKQRYVLGWIPDSEAQELKAGASRIWYLDKNPDEVKIDELGETDLTRYIESKKSAVQDLAAIGQLPAQVLGAQAISNVSADALAALESAKVLKAAEIGTSLGESHEQLMRLCAHLSGDAAAADDYEAEVRWRDMSTRSLAQITDALGKMVQMLGMPPEIAAEDLPGMTDAKLKRVAEAMKARANQTTPQG